MKPGLLKSFIILALFWSTVAWVTFGLADPDVNLRILARMAHWMPFLHLDVPQRVSILDAAGIQYAVAKYWTAPLLLVVVVMTLVGAAAAWGIAWRVKQKRSGRERGQGEWRGVTLTKGVLPLPDYAKRVGVTLHFAPEAGDLFERLPPDERTLLLEILGTIAAYPDSYPGDGHGVSLLVHTLNVLERLILVKPDEPLALVAAAAHDLGKITAFKRDKDGKWERVKLHDRESARLLALLPGYWKIEAHHRRALAMAVKYGHAEALVPQVNPTVDALAAKLSSLVHAADGTATREEKQRLLETKDLPELILTSFLEVLPSVPFQSPGLPKGVRAVGWKKGTRLYLIEHQIRDQALARMDPDVKAALGGAYRKKTKIAPFTLELLKALDARGWLIKEIGEAKLPAQEAFWDIKAGDKEFNAITVIDVPPEILDRLPSQDTAYPITVLAPHFRAPGVVSSAALDLEGSGVFSSTKKGRKVPQQADAPMPAVAPLPDYGQGMPAVAVPTAIPDRPVVGGPAPEPLTPTQGQPLPPAEQSAAPATVVPDFSSLVRPSVPPRASGQANAPRPKAEKPIQPQEKPQIGKKDADMATAAFDLLRPAKKKV